jgi:hypothetical protein
LARYLSLRSNTCGVNEPSVLLFAKFTFLKPVGQRFISDLARRIDKPALSRPFLFNAILNIYESALLLCDAAGLMDVLGVIQPLFFAATTL